MSYIIPLSRKWEDGFSNLSFNKYVGPVFTYLFFCILASLLSRSCHQYTCWSYYFFLSFLYLSFYPYLLSLATPPPILFTCVWWPSLCPSVCDRDKNFKVFTTTRVLKFRNFLDGGGRIIITLKLKDETPHRNGPFHEVHVENECIPHSKETGVG